jgi:hypothetical protein
MQQPEGDSPSFWQDGTQTASAGQAPPSVGQPRRWTPRFLSLCALIALLGLAALIFPFLGESIGSGAHGFGALISGILYTYLASLVMFSALLVVCLVGLWLVRNKLLFVGIVLRTLVTTGAIFLLLVALNIGNIIFWRPVEQLFLSSLFLPLFSLSSGVFGFLSQVGFSYGLARWQRSDNVFIWLQLLVTLGLGALIVKDVHPPAVLGIVDAIWTISGPFLAFAGLACLLLRPACWKASPLIVLCLTAGGAASLLFGVFFVRLLAPPVAIIQIQQISSVIGIVGNTLFILGVLLLIQRARIQKRAQNSSQLAP